VKEVLDDTTVELRAGAAGQRTLRLVVYDPSPVFIHGLDAALTVESPRATIVGATPDRTELDDLVLRTGPDVVVAHASDPEDLEALRRVTAAHNSIPVLAVIEEERAWAAALAAGAHGVVPRGATPRQLVGPLHAIANGWTVTPAAVVRIHTARAEERDRIWSGLDTDERELWLKIAAGRTDPQIAEDLHVSTRTVKRHAAALFRRLDVANRVEAAALAGRLGLLDEPD
jgi:two-component system, NarL family, nitrate/nitrite response regulator NarL